MKQVISVLVENQPGVLNKITGLFSSRGFNIESLAVSVTEDESVSRITMIIDIGHNAVDQLEKQLNKLICVLKIKRLDNVEMTGRELILVKVSATPSTRRNIKDLCDIMHAKIDDVSAATLTVELADLPQQINLFLEMLRPFGIVEIARTGLIAVQKRRSLYELKQNKNTNPFSK